MVPSEEMLPSPNNTFEDEEDEDFVLNLDESSMEENEITEATFDIL